MPSKIITIRLDESDLDHLNKIKEKYQEVNRGIKFTNSMIIRVCIQRVYEDTVLKIGRLNFNKTTD